MALRERVVAFVEEGHSHRAAGARFRVSVKFVNDMVILKRKTGRLDPRAQGNGGGHGNDDRIHVWSRKASVCHWLKKFNYSNPKMA